MAKTRRLAAMASAAALVAGLLAPAPASAEAPSYSKKGEQFLSIICPAGEAHGHLLDALAAHGFDGRVLMGTPIPDDVRRAYGRVAYAEREEARGLTSGSWPLRIQQEIDYLVRAARRWGQVFERASSYRTWGRSFPNIREAISPYGMTAIRRRSSVIRRVLGLPGPGKGC